MRQTDSPHKVVIAISGASGFIGANLCRYFNNLGYSVLALEGPHSKAWRLEGLSGIHQARIDLCSRTQIQSVLEKYSPDIFINCASYGSYSIQKDPDQIYRVNFEVVRNLLDCLANFGKNCVFIQAGSSSEYGLNCRAPSETDATSPDSHYAVSKMAATSLVQYYGKCLNFPAWSLRIYSVFGPYEEASRLIPTLLSCAKRGLLPPLVNPDISRDFLFIDDLSCAIKAIIDRAPALERGAVFNIGSGRKTTIRELVEHIRSEFKVGEMPHWGAMKDRSWDHPGWSSNPGKANAVLGWQSRVNLAEGLRRMMSWREENPAMVIASEKYSILKDDWRRDQ